MTDPQFAEWRRYYKLFDDTAGEFPTLAQFLAIEADAAAAEPGLDVERLAEALFRTQAERRDLGSHEADAAAIAAEYDRLGAELEAEK